MVLYSLLPISDVDRANLCTMRPRESRDPCYVAVGSASVLFGYKSWGRTMGLLPFLVVRCGSSTHSRHFWFTDGDFADRICCIELMTNWVRFVCQAKLPAVNVIEKR